MGVRFFILFVLVAEVSLFSLDLTSLDIDEFVVNHVHVRKNCLILSVQANYKPTNEEFSPVIRVTLNNDKRDVNFFLYKKLYIPSNNCFGINKAIATTSDIYQRVYILDSSLKCPSKIVITTYPWMFVNSRIPLFDDGISPKSILALNQRNPVIIVGLSNTNIILVCTLAKECEDVVVKFPMQDSMKNELKSTEIMAISPNQDVLFFTSPDGPELFSVEIKYIRDIENSLLGNFTNVIEATYIGNLIGNTNSIFIQKSMFHYSIPKYNTILSWNMTKALSVENHEIQILSLNNTYLVQIFADIVTENLFALIRKSNSTFSSEIIKVTDKVETDDE